ncbi:CRISPR-associated endonuclease Cas1 [Geminisphaera colitermitum]|uniref:CRISPR-associated endonuclease Cas1 n=1 Tax=Geminisphaera colitermitum TaxID=1148786 RepID=UPI0005B8F184|nr:CRISPR-associated endonuclease Cas1 [Geminisphaera colitermitum]
MPPSASAAAPLLSQGDAPQDEPLPARMLNEFVYCPRLFYYEHVETLFAHNADTRRGAALHKRVDAGKGDLPPATPAPSTTSDSDAEPTSSVTPPEPDVIHTRSVSLGSDRLGVVAKMDLIEIRPPAPNDGAPGDLLAPLRVTPVDYKIGTPREGENGPEIWDADRMQLGLQCLILRDQGYACDEGVIYYRATKQRVSLLVTVELENWIHAQIAAARRCMTGRIPPPLTDSPKCPRCSLVTICLPDETRLLHDAPAHPDDEDAATTQDTFPFDRDFAPPQPSKNNAAHSAQTPSADPVTARRLVAARDDERELYITTPGTTLLKKSELIQIREKGELVNEIRIKDLSHVAIFGSATISTALLNELAERDIAVSYFSSAGTLRAYTRGPSLKNVFTRIAQFRAADTPATALRIARLFVQGKIRNQRTLIMRNHAMPPASTLGRLQHAITAAANTESIEELLGIEGSAALAYFQEFSGMIKTTGDDILDAIAEGREPEPGSLSDTTQAPDITTGKKRRSGKRDTPGQEFFSFDFTRRNRRPPRDAVNALLSLAYSILAKDCTSAAHAVGFDPYVGFYHQPRFGRPALALDLMEEFRPLVADSVVLTLINTRMISPTDFVRAGDAVNLSPAGRKQFFNAYEQRMRSMITHPVFDYKVSYRRALELQARLLAKMLTGEIAAYVPFTTR